MGCVKSLKYFFWALPAEKVLEMMEKQVFPFVGMGEAHCLLYPLPFFATLSVLRISLIPILRLILTLLNPSPTLFLQNSALLDRRGMPFCPILQSFVKGRGWVYQCCGFQSLEFGVGFGYPGRRLRKRDREAILRGRQYVGLTPKNLFNYF